jgi:hypothetical protein
MPRYVRRTLFTLLALSLALAAVASRKAAFFQQASGEATVVGAACGYRSAALVDVLAQELHKRLVTQGGCTLDPRTLQPVGPVDAYAVSLEGYESCFDSSPSPDQIAAYLRRHDALLRGGALIYVGAWRDSQTGQCYLDLSELVSDRTVAEHRGRAQRQRCIYHLATGAEIRLR